MQATRFAGGRVMAAPMPSVVTAVALRGRINAGAVQTVAVDQRFSEAVSLLAPKISPSGGLCLSSGHVPFSTPATSGSPSPDSAARATMLTRSGAAQLKAVGGRCPSIHLSDVLGLPAYGPSAENGV
jgi:hypothetical protein